MTISTQTIEVSTRGNADVHDITSQVRGAVARCEFSNGVVVLFCPSSTSALTTIEFEPGCVSDLRRLFDEIIPQNKPYAHDAAWGDGNGYSHVRAALLGASLTVPFINGRLTLGTWQQIIHVDFDNRSRRRELVVQIIGE